MSNMHIADLVPGCLVKVRTDWDAVFEGVVTWNYGASINLTTEDGRLVAVENDHIVFFEVIGKESIDAYRINQGKRRADFDAMMAKAFPEPPK